MVVIPQHGSKGEIFDISSFLAEIDLFTKPDTWHVTIDWCTGDRALEIENLSKGGLSVSDTEFRSLYQGIYQTIDGHFIGLANGVQIFELLAFDSSFWEVTGSSEFESHMLSTYGAWQRA